MAEDNGQGELNFDAPPPSLIQPDVTKAVIEDAIYRATFLTDDDRKQEMYEAIETAARQHVYLTADEVWVVLGKVGDDERDNGSGLGPVMRSALAAGVIESTGLFRRSQRPPSHGKILPIWRSLIKAGPGSAQMAKVVEVLEGKAG
jgi:hypothetical protein